jgi:hypothetical protein
MPEPSVKGTLIQAAVEELRALLSKDRVGREELACLLEPADLAILDGDITISAWYPIASYGRMIEAIGEVLERTDDEYFVETGRASARRLIELGIYSQLDERTETWEDRVGRLLVSVAGALFNFGTWKWLGLDEQGFRIELRGAAPMPRSYLLRTRGFVEYLATRAAGAPVRAEFECSDDGGTVLFRARRTD